MSFQKEIIIRPKTNWFALNLQELWDYRELFYIFAWRDLKIRYKQTLLGVIYVVFQPIVNMVIFTVFFGNLAKIPSENLPYSLFVIIGLVFWYYFSSALTRASNAMVDNQDIITKVYFPKIILPITSLITFLVDLIINTIVMLIYAVILGYIPTVQFLVFFPIAFILTFITAAGLGLLLSALNVKYRDIRNILPFFIQILLFLSPIIYPLTILSQRNKYIMAINPLTSAVDMVRSTFNHTSSIDPIYFIISSISCFSILFVGYWYFKRTERYFADIV